MVEYKKIQKASVVLCYALLILVIGIAAFLKEENNNRKNCTIDTARGSYAKILFLEPKTKTDLLSIAEEYDFPIVSMLLGARDGGGATFSSQKVIYSPALTKATLQGDTKANIARGNMSGSRDTVKTEDLVEMFDTNKAVVWSVEFQSDVIKMEQMVKLVKQLDMKGELGVSENEWFAWGTTVEEIRPKTKEIALMHEQCYKYVN